MGHIRRYASVIGLKPEKEAEYRELHAAAWPGVLDAIHRANIRNFSIFLRDNVLFSYYEYVGDDYEADMQGMGSDEVNQRWWAFTAPCQEPVQSAAEGEWWAPAEEVFHTD